MLKQAKIILQKTGADKLSSLPHVLLKALEVIHRDDLTFEQLANIIRQDPALYVKTLLIINQSKCDTTSSDSFEGCLSCLGFDTLKNLVITSAVQQFFSRYTHERIDFLKQYWQHSILCAEIAKSIAIHIGYKHSEDAYTSGLVHNIGQLVLENAHPNKYTSTFAQLSEDDYFHDLENEEFNTTHAQVGALLLREKNVNPFITDAVLYHHEPSDLILDAHPLVKITSLSNQLSSSDFKQEDKHIFESAEKMFGLSRPLLLEILETAKKEVASITSSLEINMNIDGMDGETAKHIEGDDQLKQVQLAEQVRNIAILDGANQQLAKSSQQKNLLQTIQLQAGILFGITNCSIFYYDENKNQVKALASEHQIPLLEDLCIPLEIGRSLVTTAILNKKAVHTFDDDYSRIAVIDQQLAGLSNSDGILCVPMMNNSTTVGTLVIGVNEDQQKQLCKQLTLLNRFAAEVAHTLKTSLHPDAASDDEDVDVKISQIVKSNREIAHEIRNPLSIINNYLEILSCKLDTEHPARQDLGTIRSEITRIGSILEKLSSPARITDTGTPVDINTAIEQLTHFFQNSLIQSKPIQIELELDKNMPLISCDINAIKQIYTNLVKNAIEALPANGKIMVYTSNNVNVSGKKYVEITVADNGPGITEDVLPKLFSPIETKKGNDHSGLGLAIVNDLVNDLNGTVSCKSNNKGTSFHILLPKM